MHFIFGNYGNNTLALIQWVKERGLPDVYMIHIDTGWSGLHWNEHVQKGQTLAQQYGFQTVTLQPQKPFPELINQRKNFPTKKFQWCTTFLKALPFLQWLEDQDPQCEATILLGSRRCDSRLRQDLPEYILESEHYNGRKVWYPLFEHSNDMRDELIYRANLTPLTHRSLECDPCIHDKLEHLSRLGTERHKELRELQKVCGQEMLTPCMQQSNTLEAYDMGCGSYYVCGE